jgi:PAS domain S-box-containing protein
MEDHQLHQTIEILQQKVVDLEAEKLALMEKQTFYPKELSGINKPINFNYTLQVLQNLRRYMLEKRERYLSGLVEIQGYLLSCNHPDEVFDAILDIVGQCSQANRVCWYENYQDAEGNVLAHRKYQWCHGDEAVNSAEVLDFDYQRGCSRWWKILSRGQYIAQSWQRLSEAERSFFGDRPLVKVLLLPLIVNRTFFGFLGLEHCGPQADWESSEIAILESIVGSMSLVWQRCQAQTKLEKLNQELEDRVRQRTFELEQKNRELEQEIIKHEQTTNALQKSKERLEAVLDAVPASISWISSDLHYLGVNKQLASLINLTPSDLVNQPVGGPKSHYEFVNYLGNFFASDLDKSSAEFTMTDNKGENTFLMVAKKYDQGSAAVLVGVDITDRRRVEAALIKSAALNQAILTAIPDSMFYLTEDGTFLRCKIANGQELPFCCETLRGRKIEEILPASITSQFVEAIAKTVAEDQIQLIEFQLANEHGQMFDWEVRLALSHQDKVVAIWRNITEQKQSELALRSSEERFRATFEQAAVGIAHVAPDGSWLRVNEKLCQITGYSRWELLASNFQSITHPDDLPLDLEYVNKMLSGEISTYSTEKRYIHRNGQPIWINFTVAIVRNSPREGTYFIGVIEDISRRKQTEQALWSSSSRLKMALDAANMGTWEWNLTNGEQIWSEQSQILFGFSQVNFSFNYQMFLHRIHPEDRERVEKAIVNSLSQHLPYDIEYRIIFTDKKIHWIASKGDLFSDSQGNPISIIGIDMDITQRKNIEEEMRKSLIKEKELNQLKSNFISMTSHEFRTPLSTILGCTELLEHYGDQWNKTKKHKYLNQIYSTIQNLTSMLDDMLLIGKSESGGFEFEPSLINLSNFCHNLLQDFNLDQHQRIIFKINSENSQISEQKYLIDQKLIRHILTNLLSNALKYSSETIDFNLTYQSHQIIFSIQDHGIGISPQDLKQIFETFHRGENVGKIQGSGLGLSIVKKAIEIHRGQITIESKLNQGTLVQVIIPIDTYPIL